MNAIEMLANNCTGLSKVLSSTMDKLSMNVISVKRGKVTVNKEMESTYEAGLRAIFLPTFSVDDLLMMLADVVGNANQANLKNEIRHFIKKSVEKHYLKEIEPGKWRVTSHGIIGWMPKKQKPRKRSFQGDRQDTIDLVLKSLIGSSKTRHEIAAEIGRSPSNAYETLEILHKQGKVSIEKKCIGNTRVNYYQLAEVDDAK